MFLSCTNCLVVKQLNFSRSHLTQWSDPWEVSNCDFMLSEEPHYKNTHNRMSMIISVFFYSHIKDMNIVISTYSSQWRLRKFHFTKGKIIHVKALIYVTKGNKNLKNKWYVRKQKSWCSIRNIYIIRYTFFFSEVRFDPVLW